MKDDELENISLKIPCNNDITMHMKGIWIVKFTEEKGIEFNKKYFASYTEDDFVKEFINIMEKTFTIKFTKKENL